jgi:predicted metal-dependent hydrolase
MQQMSLDFSGIPFPFELVRSRRKTLVLYVKGGKVEVRAPLRASTKWISSFIEERVEWVQQQIKDQRKRKQESLKLVTGTQIQLLDQTLTLAISVGKQNKATRHGNTLHLYVKEHSHAKVEKLFLEWLLAEAKRYMPPLTLHYAKCLGLAHKLKAITYRQTKTKWGHCSQDGTIQFNWLVMLAPQPVLNYLIAHETSHLRHLNHSAKFWNTLGELCPDYKVHRDWLTDNGHRLWIAA